MSRIFRPIQLAIGLITGMAMIDSNALAQLGLSTAQEAERERQARVATEIEVGTRMFAVQHAVLQELEKTRDLNLIDWHYANDNLHSSYGDLAGAARRSGIGITLCDAGTPDEVRDDWLLTWYDPPPDLAAVATPKRVETMTASPAGHVRGPGVFARSLLWIGTSSLRMAGGHEVPDGLMDCHGDYGKWNTVGLVANPRIPAIEPWRKKDRDSEILSCPAGKVGSGIYRSRERMTILNGFQEAPPLGQFSIPASMPAGTVEIAPGVFESPWEITLDACRDPDTGTRFSARTCILIDSGASFGMNGVRIVEVSWTEEQVIVAGGPDEVRIVEDGRTETEVVPCGDWDSIGEAALKAPLYIPVDETETRNVDCALVWTADWGKGSREEKRTRTTLTVKWPSFMNRADDVTVSRSSWQVSSDDCHGEFPYIRKRTESRSCPTGQTGSESWEMSQTFTMRKYAQPVPARADEELNTSAWSERRLSSSCRVIQTTTTGSDDDDDNNWFHTPRPSGGNPPVRPRSPHKGSNHNNPINVGTSTHPGINP